MVINIGLTIITAICLVFVLTNHINLTTETLFSIKTFNEKLLEVDKLQHDIMLEFIDDSLLFCYNVEMTSELFNDRVKEMGKYVQSIKNKTPSKAS